MKMKMTTSVTAASAMVCALLLVFAQCASTQPSSGGGTPHKHTPHGWGSSGAYRPHQNSANLTGRTGIPGRKMFSIGADIYPQESFHPLFAAGEEPKELLRVSGGAAADIHNLVDEEQANSGSKQASNVMPLKDGEASAPDAFQMRPHSLATSQTRALLTNMTMDANITMPTANTTANATAAVDSGRQLDSDPCCPCTDWPRPPRCSPACC